MHAWFPCGFPYVSSEGKSLFFHPVLHTFYFIQIYDMINDLVLFLVFFLIETNNCVYSKVFFYYQTDGAIYVYIFGAMVVSHVAKFAGCNAIFFIYRPVSFVTFLFDVHIRILKSCQRAS